MAGLTIINRSAEQAHEWINELQQEMRFPREQSAYAGLRATLHTLRDSLTTTEAAELADQLPTLVRGIFFEGWNPSPEPQRFRDTDEFTQKITERLRDHPEIDTPKTARAVFALLDRHVSAGEIDDVIGVMPKSLHKLWPNEAVSRADQAQARQGGHHGSSRK